MKLNKERVIKFILIITTLAAVAFLSFFIGNGIDINLFFLSSALSILFSFFSIVIIELYIRIQHNIDSIKIGSEKNNTDIFAILEKFIQIIELQTEQKEKK